MKIDKCACNCLHGLYHPETIFKNIKPVLTIKLLLCFRAFSTLITGR